MKVVDKKTFLTLPQGTFFCKGVQWVFYDICIKGETLSEYDFYYSSLCEMHSNNSKDFFDQLENSLTCGISYSLNHSEGRDGTYDMNDLFLIYEKEDLSMIKNLIDKYLQQ